MELESKVLAKEILYILYESGKTVSTAESCTSGRVAETITTMPGASAYFSGGIVAYSNEIKSGVLGVDVDVLEEKTAVCEEVAVQMVKGACKMMNTDYAIATTGIAGPGGGTLEIPVGTIYVACGTEDDVRVAKLTEDDGRDINVARATNKALALFLELLREEFPQPDMSEVPVPEAK